MMASIPRQQLDAYQGSNLPIVRGTAKPGRRVALGIGGAIAIAVAGVLLGKSDDAGALVWFNQWHTGTIGAIASGAYNILEPLPSLILTVIVTALVWWRTNLRVAAAFAGVIALTWIPSDLLKYVVGRARPDALILPHPFSPAQADPSFPSGHTVFVAAFFATLVLVIGRPRWRLYAALLGLVCVATLGVSVLIDALHYPTDVVASLAWVACVLPAARWLWVDLVLPRVPLPSLGESRAG